MTWDRLAVLINALLGVLLVVRLLSLRLHRVYGVFCALIIVQLAGALVIFLQITAPNHVDYRKSWLLLTVAGWVASLSLLYVFLGAVMHRLRGLLSFSRKLLNIVFAAAAIVTLLITRSALSNFVHDIGLNNALTLALLIDEAISMVALLVLLAILSFVLWFPVQMPRNLVVFSFGLLVYFAAQIGVALGSQFMLDLPRVVFSATATILSGICFLYWALTITADGERVPVRIGHRWEPKEQSRLLDQLETMNAALLRGARRS
jgi:hypothetical protein